MVRLFRFLVVVSAISLYATMSLALSVKKIAVRGNHRADAAVVIEKMKAHTGTMSEEDLEQGLKALYATGFFADISYKVQDGVLLISVVENPTVNQVAYEGNHGVTDKILQTETKLRPRLIYTKTMLQNEVQRILAIYRAKGFFGAKVYPKIIHRDQNRVDIVFEIDEGDPAKIASVNFVGNKHFSDWTLSAVITTQESVWWKFFSTSDVYDPDKLEMDRDQLRKFYLNHGYVDFRILSAMAELMPNYDAFIITFNLEEGQRYEFGEVSIENHVKDLPTEKLQEALVPKKGEWYSAALVEHTIEVLTNKIGSLGWSFVDVTPVPDINEKDHTVGIKFVLQPSPKVFVNRINIEGNARTVDEVLRREFVLAEGDAFNVSKLRTSDHRLQNLGFFKKVDIKEVPVKGRPDLLDLNVFVKEQSTGDVNFSVGYATTDGVMGMIKVAERNLFGRGYELSSTLELAKRRRSIFADFVNPRFLNRDLMGGIGVFYTKINRGDTSSYDEKSYGLRPSIGYMLMPHLIQRWSYTISRDEIGTVGKNAFPLVRQDKGKFTSSVIGHELIYDRRNNRFLPSAGYVASISNEYAGLGGNIRYLKNMVSGAYYKTLAENVILGVDAQFGVLTELGRRIRIADKFMLGGQSLRGFDYSGVGPHGFGVVGKNKLQWDDALGGDTLATFSAQINFPLGLPEDLAISGHVFFDAGTLWDTKLKRRAQVYNQSASAADQIRVTNSKKVRMSVGAGITWISPIGSIGIDYGYVISKARGDEVRPLLLQIGSGKF